MITIKTPRFRDKWFFLFFILSFFSLSCAVKPGKKPSVDFKYWSVDHKVDFNSLVQNIEQGTAQIISFEASERRSVLGRDNWNVNVEILLTNNSKSPLILNDNFTSLNTPKSTTGLSRLARPKNVNDFIVKTDSKNNSVFELSSGKAAKVAIGYSFGSDPLVDQPIFIMFGKSKIIVK